MMECESSLAYDPYAVKKEEPSLGWPLGVSDLNHLEPFTVGTAASVYPQSFNIKTEQGPAYTNQLGIDSLGWEVRRESTEDQGYNPSGQNSVPGQGHPATDITNAFTGPDIGYGNAALQDDPYELNAMSDLTMGYSTNRSNIIPSQNLWQQQQPHIYSDEINSMVPLGNPKAAMAISDSLPAFAPPYDPEETLSGYTLSVPNVQELPGAMSPSEPTPFDDYTQAWQTDENLQMGFTPLVANPLPHDLLQPEAVAENSNAGLTSCCVPVTITTAEVQLTLDDSVKDFFTPEELGLASNAPGFTLSAAPDDGQLSQHSREVSVPGSWESPRTPYSWDSRILSSPVNGPSMLISESRVEDSSNGHLEVTTTVQIKSGHPSMEELTGNFDACPKRQSSKRKRKAYSMEGKQKVNSVREKGACVSCHARKVPCSKDGSCEPCLKITGDPILAREICLRQKLKDTFIGVKVIHETLDNRKERLQPLLASLTGEPKTVDLKVANTRQGYAFQLHLKVMTCSSSPSCRWKRLAKVNGIYVTRDVIHDQRFVIVPESLPTVDQFDAFGRKILSFANGSHSGNLTRYLDDFLLGYCRGIQTPELQVLANATLRIASLNRLVAYGFLNLNDGSYDLLDRQTGNPITENRLTRRYVSETVHDQLRILAAEGLEPTEGVVFAKLDNLNKIMGKVPNSRLLVGICILRLILLYRDRVIRDSIRLGLPGSGDRHRVRLQKAAFMYKRLTIVYGTLCRESTPLSMTWLPENETNPTPRDLTLMESFSKLQPAFEQFCREKLTPEHDDIFQKLIVEGPKMDRRPSKKQKSDSRARASTA